MDKNNINLSKALDKMLYVFIQSIEQKGSFMNKTILEKVMLDNQKEVEGQIVIPRNFPLDGFDRYVIVGIRRAGKSYLLYQRIQQLLKEGHKWDEMLYLNFEDERLEGFSTQDFNMILEAHMEMYGKRPMLFLDEVQNVAGWEKFARRLADAKYKVIITGSNAKMLSSDIQTTLGGRYLPISVYPYSFKEFLDVSHVAYDRLSILSTEGKAKVVNRMNDYIHNGGFPEGALMKVKRDYLMSVYQKIYLGDIAARNNVTNVFGLKVMIKKIAESVKQPISFNRMANIISTTGTKLSTTSAVKYMGYLEEAWLINRVTNIASKLADKEGNAKYYFTDNGILNLFLIDAETSLLENLVAIYLTRKYGREDAVFFYNKEIEVDFYIPDDETAIQVSYSLKDDDTRMREVKALKALQKVLPCKKLFIITYDDEDNWNLAEDNITVIPVWKWALG